MALLRPDQNPTISDTILFDILTPDSGGCFSADPYVVNNVTIYYVYRDTANGSNHDYTINSSDPTLEAQLAVAKQVACNLIDPTLVSLQLQVIANIENQLAMSSRSDNLYYSESKAVATFGTDDFPAWLSSDPDNALIEHITTDSNNNTICGDFQLQWNPVGMREGDYIICWSWSPLPAGTILTSNQYFSLHGDTAITTSIPTHLTDPEKYITLQDRYLPEMFKMTMLSSDLTPQVIQGFNNSVADGFTFMEDLANQVVDLLDANATNESMLQVLANTFGLKLRSHDPTLWRRQIKNAVPLFKQKGTLPGLITALAQADIQLNKFTKLWQIVSKYTFQESFTATASSQNANIAFSLSKVALYPIDTSNFELYYRGVNSTTWTALNGFTPSHYVTLSNDGKTLTYKTGITPVVSIGDSLRVVYLINSVPTSPEQTLENVIRTLDLADQRDERLQTYPLKNWNVRVIAEDHPLINQIIPQRHPFHDPVIFGSVRTEFPYSENIYNMEEYNGSTRQSPAPCDMDREFIDPCSNGQSSKFTVDLEIGALSNDRISEAQDIISENKPFHAVLHAINLYGGWDEFVQSPTEDIEAIVQVVGEEVTLTDPQLIFNRSMEFVTGQPGTTTSGADNLTKYQFHRTEMAMPTTVVSMATGTIKNDKVMLFYPGSNLDNISLSTTSSLTYFQILAPDGNAGTYHVQSPVGHRVEVIGLTNTNSSGFTFNLFNEVIRANSVASATQEDIFAFSDPNLNLIDIGIESLRHGGTWALTLPSGTYDVIDFTTENALIIQDNGSLTGNLANATYTLIYTNGSGTPTYTGSTGQLLVFRQALINLGTSNILLRGSLVATSSMIALNAIIDNTYFVDIAETKYRIVAFSDSNPHACYVEGIVGTQSGISLVIYQPLVHNGIGYLSYSGITLVAGSNIETSLSIVNGANPPIGTVTIESDFKEDYLVAIDAGTLSPGNTFYYSMSQVNGTTVNLIGPWIDWTPNGITTAYSILHFSKSHLDIPERLYPPMPPWPPAFQTGEETTLNTLFSDQDQTDRNTSFPVTFEITQPNVPGLAHLRRSAQHNNDQVAEFVSQGETITVTIEHRD